MGGFDEKIRRQPSALESGFVRTRQRLLSPDFFIKSILYPDDEKNPRAAAFAFCARIRIYSSLSPLSLCILIFETSQSQVVFGVFVNVRSYAYVRIFGTHSTWSMSWLLQCLVFVEYVAQVLSQCKILHFTLKQLKKDGLMERLCNYGSLDWV